MRDRGATGPAADDDRVELVRLIRHGDFALPVVFGTPAERRLEGATPVEIGRLRLRRRKRAGERIRKVVREIRPPGTTGVAAVLRMREGPCVSVPAQQL